MTELVGVFREAQFSPGRVDDDASILTGTAVALRARGFGVHLWTADRLESGEALPSSCRAVLAMCQAPGALAALDRIATDLPVINDPTAIRRCYRQETVPALRDTAVPFPRTTVVATQDAPAPGAAPCWVKRGDVHAMERADVVFAPTDAAVADVLAAFAARGISRAALQAHVDGPVLKFYGVADGSFFRCYTDADAVPAELDALWEVALAGARALGLDVFGGDLVVPPSGPPVLIDVNDWPSFARCRDEAATAIARYVARRVAPEHGLAPGNVGAVQSGSEHP